MYLCMGVQVKHGGLVYVYACMGEVLTNVDGRIFIMLLRVQVCAMPERGDL